MGYASRSGHAITNPSAPEAFGVCDGCGFWFQLHTLKYQFEWQGTQLVNLKYRHCSKCMDTPNPQLKTRMPGPDPIPVRDPRPEFWSYPHSRQFLATEPGPGNPRPLTPIGKEQGGAMEIEP